MRPRALRPLALAGALTLTFTAGAAAGRRVAEPPSAIVSRDSAQREDASWGTLYTYYEGEGYSTKDLLAAVAVIKPGREIHPPHRHAEEEYLMVVEGEGRWHLKGVERPARAGDMQYAAPWDVHGIRNTGRTPLRFVVWKWNGKGVPPKVDPQH
jgi:mannose-6-phosphate isomerase-like protein (cupin superfamily)